MRVWDSISMGMGTIIRVRSHFHIVWYTVRLDSGKVIARRGEELRLATKPDQYGLTEIPQEEVTHWESSERTPTEVRQYH